LNFWKNCFAIIENEAAVKKKKSGARFAFPGAACGGLVQWSVCAPEPSRGVDLNYRQ
jgi:hypothetical protein